MTSPMTVLFPAPLEPTSAVVDPAGARKDTFLSTGTSVKTLLQLVAAANHGVLVDEVSISFQGTSNTASPIRVRVLHEIPYAAIADMPAELLARDVRRIIATELGEPAAAAPQAAPRPPLRSGAPAVIRDVDSA